MKQIALFRGVHRSRLTIILGLLLVTMAITSAETVVWSEEFDDPSAPGRWQASSGVWEIGSPDPTIGPGEGHNGSPGAAGTNLSGNYPDNATSRLVRTRTFVVPEASRHPRLRFWHWFSFSSDDYGVVEISTNNGATWTAFPDSYSQTSSGVWTRPCLDLTNHAGQEILIAFRFISRNVVGAVDVSSGWYLDDVEVVEDTPMLPNPESFDGGLGDWCVSHGTWQVGSSTLVPPSPVSGGAVAGTVLEANYSDTTPDTRLITPPFTVPAASTSPRLRFWHWFSFSSDDYGVVEISTNNGATWTAFPDSYSQTSSGMWTRPCLDLTNYASQEVIIAFRFSSRNVVGAADVSSGWYLDDVEVVQGSPVLPNPESFDAGLGDWCVSHGTWQVGRSTLVPPSPVSGGAVAGTVLEANYSDTTPDTRLITPPFTVPAASTSPRLRFWHWFSFSSDDYGVVEISTNNGATWTAFPDSYSQTSSGVWTRPCLDLTNYAGQEVLIAFRFSSRNVVGAADVSSGWYLDDVEVVQGSPVLPNPESFDAGLGDWCVSHGTWQVGRSTLVPPSPVSGGAVAGTVLEANYSDTTPDTRLITPPFTVPAASTSPRLRFWHWFSFSSDDYGIVEISTNNGATWTAFPDSYSQTSSGVWTRPCLDLTNYAGQEVIIAFRFSSRNVVGAADVSSGWYLDDVEVVQGFPVLPNPESFDAGLGDWCVSHGTWQVGRSTLVPPSPVSGGAVAGTVLEANYSDTTPDTRLITPPFTVPAASTSPRLRFWHWFSFSSDDYGVVEISTNNGATWTAFPDSYSQTSSGMWTRPCLDLTNYAGQEVIIAFRFSSRNVVGAADVSSGWYLDDVEVVQGSPVLPNPEAFDGGLGDWCVSHGTWQVGRSSIAVPPSPVSGGAVAGTVLQGNYSDTTPDTRLISPPFTVPDASASPHLRFWHWYSFSSDDGGFVEISADNGVTWTSLPGSYSQTSGGTWTQPSRSLSAYANQEVLIAFRFSSRNVVGAADVSSGWYIDDVQITSDLLSNVSNHYIHPERTPLEITTHSGNQPGLRFSLEGAPDGASINPTTGAFSWTPTEQQGPGVYDLTIVLKQSRNSLAPLASRRFTVEVLEVNDPPVLEPIGPQIVTEGETLSFTVNATDDDNTNLGNITVFEAGRFTDNSLGSWTSFSVTSNRNWGPGADNGEHYAFLDGLGADAASDDWLISPVLDFDAAANETARFRSLRENAGPDLEVLVTTDYTGTGDPGAATWTPLRPVLPVVISEWTYSRALDLSDFTGTGYLAFHYTSSGANPGQAARWQVDDIELRGDLGAPLQQSLTYSMDPGAPTGASFDSNTRQFSWTPTEADSPGTFHVTIRVTDNGVDPPEQSATETFVITVQEVNSAPTLDPINDVTIDEETALSFSAMGADPDDLPANPLTYELAGAPEGATISETGAFSWTPTEEQGPGEFTMIVTVRDSSPEAINETSLSAMQSFTVTVNEVNKIPTLEPLPAIPTEVEGGTEINFTARAIDSDDPINTLTFSLVNAPAGASIDPGTGEFVWTTPIVQHDTSFSGIKIIVTDDGVPILSDTVVIPDITVRGIGDDYRDYLIECFGAEILGNPALEATVWGDLADPDHDGTVNLMEFLTARNPKVSDRELGPTFRCEGDWAILTYRQTTSMEHSLSLIGRWSPDLRFWTSVGLAYEIVADHGNYVVMEVRIRKNEEPKLFLRLQASR